MAIKVKRGEYIFLPKLRSICVLDRIVEKVSIYYLLLNGKLISAYNQDYNTAAIKTLAKKPVSPMKKMKRKVGYRTSSFDESSNDDIHPPPNKQLRALVLGTTEGDVPMKEVA